MKPILVGKNKHMMNKIKISVSVCEVSPVPKTLKKLKSLNINQIKRLQPTTNKTAVPVPAFSNITSNSATLQMQHIIPRSSKSGELQTTYTIGGDGDNNNNSDVNYIDIINKLNKSEAQMVKLQTMPTRGGEAENDDNEFYDDQNDSDTADLNGKTRTSKGKHINDVDHDDNDEIVRMYSEGIRKSKVVADERESEEYMNVEDDVLNDHDDREVDAASTIEGQNNSSVMISKGGDVVNTDDIEIVDHVVPVSEQVDIVFDDT